MGDAHRLMVVDTDTTVECFLEFYEGESASRIFLTSAVFKAQTNQINESPIDIQMPRVSNTGKIWCRVMHPLENGKTISFYYGLHGYRG